MPQTRCPPRQPAVDGLPTISGIHTATGLQYLNGNLAGYLRLLAKFRLNQGESVTAIRTALAAQDWPTAERLAHTLKGVAATIGANTLCQQAGALEAALRNRTDAGQMQPHLQETAAQLASICTALDQVLPRQTPLHPLTTTETATAITHRNALLRQAFRQLMMFDAAVDETMALLRTHHLTPTTLGWMTQLEQQIAHYDFENAVKTLQECAAALDVDLEREP